MGRFISNRNDVKAKIDQGGWVDAYGRELTETDAFEGLVAAGVSIYTGSPAVVLAWLDALITDCLHRMEASIATTFTSEARSVAQSFARGVITNLLHGRTSGESFHTFGHFGIKAGVAKFIGQNQEWNPVAHPGDIFHGDAGDWQNIGPGLVSYCPYVGLRIQSPVDTPHTSPPGSLVEYALMRFVNSTPAAINLAIRWSPSSNWDSAVVPSGTNHYWWHSTNQQFWEQFAHSPPQYMINTGPASGGAKVSIVKTGGHPTWDSRSSVTGRVDFNIITLGFDHHFNISEASVA